MRPQPALLLLGLLVGCREGVPPFTPTGPDAVDTDPRQLTFGTGDERDPQWSADGDSIYFQSSNWFDAPGPGTLLRISPDGGSAAPLADRAQPNPGTFLSNASGSPSGDRLAYLHLARVLTPISCLPSDREDPPGHFCLVPEPVLDSAQLRVRAATAVNPATVDPGLALRFPGVDPQQQLGGFPPYYQRVYPFHVDWVLNAESAALRPSWAPDGNRIAFSDGTRLYTWTTGDVAAQPIPNTLDGVAAAWSPDGNWIAFTIIERGDSTVSDCLCGNGGSIRHLRTSWEVLGYRLAVIRPDGSGMRLLGDGRDPAWAPDSRTLYLRRGNALDGAIYAIAVDAPSAVQLVPGTAGGRAPAVSPDGVWLAFTRRKDFTGDLDLWIKRLGS